MEKIEEKIRKDCWGQAKQCFGYSYIFSKKASINNKLLSALKILGLIIPFIIGTIALGGTDSKFISALIYVGGFLMTFQAVISAFAIFVKWDDNYAYYIESKIDRANLSEDFKELANISSASIEELKLNYSVLKAKLKSREAQDAKYDLMDWELKMGMRSALREFQSNCVGCKKVPLSMEPTKCEICGNYKKTVLYKLFRI